MLLACMADPLTVHRSLEKPLIHHVSIQYFAYEGLMLTCTGKVVSKHD